MDTARGERGQAAISYAGVLALLGLVFVAVFALGLDGRVSRAVAGSVCMITGGSNCERPDGTTGGRPEEYEDSGRADREVYDADCDNSLPGDRVREGDDGPTGDERGGRRLGEPRAHLRLLPRHVRPRLLRQQRGRARGLGALLRDARRGLRQRLLERRPDGLRRGLRRAAGRDGPRAHARDHRPHRGPRLPVPVRRAQRVLLGHLRLQRRHRRLGDRRGPAQRRDPRHGRPRPLRRPGARRRLRHAAQRRRPGQRPRRRALQLAGSRTTPTT